MSLEDVSNALIIFEASFITTGAGDDVAWTTKMWDTGTSLFLFMHVDYLYRRGKCDTMVFMCIGV